jgi:hypothetical protein
MELLCWFLRMTFYIKYPLCSGIWQLQYVLYSIYILYVFSLSLFNPYEKLNKRRTILPEAIACIHNRRKLLSISLCAFDNIWKIHMPQPIRVNQ